MPFDRKEYLPGPEDPKNSAKRDEFNQKCEGAGHKEAHFIVQSDNTAGSY